MTLFPSILMAFSSHSTLPVIALVKRVPNRRNVLKFSQNIQQAFLIGAQKQEIKDSVTNVNSLINGNHNSLQFQLLQIYAPKNQLIPIQLRCFREVIIFDNQHEFYGKRR
jgi:hypothetical protein